MSEFPAVIALSSLNGSNGFRLDGAAGDLSGASVSSAGDINGDGFADVIVGAVRADSNGISNAGSSFVVFGKASGFAATQNLSSLNGSNGFRVDGAADGDNTGNKVSSAGDINGDGFDDFIIGAYTASPNGSSSGSSYVVFGKAGGFSQSLSLSSLDGSNGFRLDGLNVRDELGRSLSSAGDVNGDGLADIIIAAPFATVNGSRDAGSSYVVFGSKSGFGKSLDLSSLDGSNGFRLDGAAANTFTGYSVSSAGDVNGDGLDDLIVGSYRADPNGDYSGSSYVVFGSKASFGQSLNLSSLDGSNGFRLDGAAAGDESGFSVSSAGDVNGDGLADLIVGAPRAPSGTSSGSSYVVFGSKSGFGKSLDLSSLDGSNGFRLDGAAADDFSGFSVSSAGDINGDGFGDLIVGASLADSNGNNSGSSFVVFGKAGGFAATQNLSSLDGSNGFRVDGAAAGDLSGRSVSAAGDVNGDGFGDLVVGALDANTNGSYSGASYVVFGRAPDAAATRVGTDTANAIRGGAFDDNLQGQGGNDSLFGSGGDDDLFGSDGNDRLDGGTGADLMVGNAGDDTFVVNSASDLVRERAGQGTDTVLASLTYTLGAYIENLTLTGTAAINGTGNELANVLTGNGAANVLDGADGNDTLKAGAGNDTLKGGVGNDALDGGTGNDDLTGGAGDDRFYVDSLGDAVHENANEGIDNVYASKSYTLTAGASIEYLRASGSGNFALTGNDQSNSVVGGAGNDTLDGGSAGTDKLYGGLGDDTYVITRTSGVYIIENPNQGIDTVQASVGHTLAANVENLTLTGASAINGTGNTLANVITGNGAINTLQGGDGNDTLVGGGGPDRLYGGAGSDVFVFKALSDSTLSARDGIYDFVEGGTDKIDLSGIDANANIVSDQAFTLITGGYTGVAGQLRTFASSSVTYVEGDVNGDRKADFQIVLTGVHTLHDSDFVL